MDPMLVNLLEPAVVFATLLGTAFGVKLLIWGKGPIRRVRTPEDRRAIEQRMVDFEEHVSEAVARQADRLAELEERLDFTERMLTQHREEDARALRKPGPSSTA